MATSTVRQDPIQESCARSEPVASTTYDSPNVMISYQWDAQERMLTLKDELVKAGYNVWMDVEKMVGNMDDRMADAVEKAVVVVICYSEKYHNSQSCKTEAQYAKSLKKTIIPLRYQNFQPSGWLGLMVNPLLHYNVETHVDLKSNMSKILEAVERGVKEHREKEPEPLRLALIGMTGTGKSATGNSVFAWATDTVQYIKDTIGDAIVKLNPFKSKSSSKSVTVNCKRKDAVILGRNVSLVDTPGFFDTDVSLEITVQEIMKCVLLVAPGPHAILAVIKAGRFTKEVTDAVTQMRLMLGESSIKFLILVFTGMDNLAFDGETLEDYLDELTGECRTLVEDCNHRCIGFNNRLDTTSEGNKTQVEKLLRMAEKIKKDNGGLCYTNEHLRLAEQVVQEQIKKRQAEIDQSEQEKLKLLNTIADLQKNLQQATQREGEIQAQLLRQMDELKKGFQEQNAKLQKLKDEALEEAANSKELAGFQNKMMGGWTKPPMASSSTSSSSTSSSSSSSSSTGAKKGGCFAAGSIVRVLDSNGQVHATRLSDLKIGDLVESYDPNKDTIAFSEVYYITYQDEFGTSSTLRQLWYDDVDLDLNHSQRSIRLHADHLIYATKGGQGSAEGPPATPVMSKQVAVGDLIWVKSNGGTLVPVPVKMIEEVVVNVRHPMTLSHYIIVDDVLASVHMNNEWLLRRVTWPLRYLYGWSPSLNDGWFTKRCVQSWDWVEDHMMA